MRDIVSFSLAPQGDRFAILIREGDPRTNVYRNAWFVGAASARASLVFAGDGGEVRFIKMPNGSVVGDLGGSVARWSGSGEWFAYTVQRHGETQLWRSRFDGSAQQQLSRNAGDVRDFFWTDDDRTLLFTAGASRTALLAGEEAGRRNGFWLNDFQSFDEIIFNATLVRPLETDMLVWAIDADGRHERPADALERSEFMRSRRRTDARLGGGTEVQIAQSSSEIPAAKRADGAMAWLSPLEPHSAGLYPSVRLTVSFPNRAMPVPCLAPECTGPLINKVWWPQNGERVYFWRKEGPNQTDDGLYAWAPSSGALEPLLRSKEQWFRQCDLRDRQLICVRETATHPAHLAAIDLRTGSVAVIAEVNPELRHFRFGAVERFEWKLPRDTAGLGYPEKGRGYILYPPHFRADRRYPAIVCPYGASGFKRGDVGNEQPMHVYAARGFIVINSEFPLNWGSLAGSDQVTTLRKMYSPELRFPHLTMLADSTFRAIDAVAARGFVDERRVGIGGVSHGTFVPFFMMQRQDRLAALSVSASGWSDEEYYYSTRFGRELLAREVGPGERWPQAREFWSQIDIADHVDEIEAPILFHFSDREALLAPRLIRRLDDARKPYDAYVFRDEYHVKWQPAHRYAVYERNLDWFRFWLQDEEDPAPSKQLQYARWRELRELQCKNPRTLRSDCERPATPSLSPTAGRAAPPTGSPRSGD